MGSVGTLCLPRCPTLLHYPPLRNPCASGALTVSLRNRDRLRVHPRSGHRARTTAGGEREGLGILEPRREPEGEARREAVPRAVRVARRLGERRSRERPARLRPAAECPGRGHAEPRRWVEVA